MRTAEVIAGVLAISMLWSVAAVSAASPPARSTEAIVVDVEGQQIKPALTSSFYCHDFDYPRIHCFRTAAKLKAAETTIFASRLAASPNFTSADYVTIFDGVAYTGAAMDLSQNYDALWSIGWNDRISSYKARNSVSGTFWTDWFASGTGRNFCCNTNVSSLPSDLDNAFSSVYRH
jgi:hypothetical protein